MLVHGQVPFDEHLRHDLFELQNRVRLSLVDETERTAEVSRDDPRVRFVHDVLALIPGTRIARRRRRASSPVKQ
jgi:hypothetical protein